MKLAVEADHAGFDLKERVKSWLREDGHQVVDEGTYSAEPLDYPDVAVAIARALREGRAERGVLICGSGVGASIAANKIAGVRAGLCHDSYSARQGVEHDDMNVLVLGARVIGPAVAHELIGPFVGARFSGDERHRRRLAKIDRLEAPFGAGGE